MDKSAITLERMQTFVRVAERGSLSCVARELDVGQSTITRHLSELEQAVGVPLLSRTTRRVTLTDEGSAYYTNCVSILRLVEQARDEARSNRGTPAGTIRLSCTTAFGVMHICRLLFGFQDRYPEIGIDLSLTDERINLVREGVDIAIRLGPLSDSSMKLRALGTSRRLLVAAPHYLDKMQRPQTPAETSRHIGIRMSNIAGSDTLSLLRADGELHTLYFGGNLKVDNGLAAREALIAGRGLVPAHRWLVDDLLVAGKLEVVLPDYTLPSVPLSMLIVPERAGVSRVRLLVEFLTQEVLAIPGIE